MEARRERIADMVKELLPSMQESERKLRKANIMIAASIIWIVILGGYVMREYTRTINTSEYTILQGLITLAAQDNNEPVASLTQEILSQFQIGNLEELKARDWRETLKFIASKNKH